jgi:hypothetical protein
LRYYERRRSRDDEEEIGMDDTHSVKGMGV